MYHILKQITAPFSFFFLLMSIGFFCLFFYGDNYFVDVYLFITWTLFYIGSTNWFCLMVSKKYRKHYPLKDMNASIEWVVVLGGGAPANKTGTHADNFISDTSMQRLLKGIRVYRELPLAKLLLSGGGKNKNSLESVAEKVKYIAMGLGVPEQAIIVEPHSKNTKEEAAYIKDIVKENPFYLVTSSTHMQRAVAIFRDKGLPPLRQHQIYRSI